MAIGGSIINLDMPERDADNGSWVAGTPAAYFSQESKDAVERLLYDRDTNSSDGGGFLSVLGIRPFGHPALHRSRLRPVPGTARRLQPKSAVLLRHPHELDFRLRRRRRLTGATAALPDAKGPEGGAFPGNRRNHPKGKAVVPRVLIRQKFEEITKSASVEIGLGNKRANGIQLRLDALARF